MKKETLQEWLGKDNTLGQDIWEKKYRHNQESFSKWLDRVSNNDPALRKLIYEKKFLFGGRVLSNRGVDTRSSYFNCYSYGFVEDDYEKLLDAAKKLGITFKYQGGQGISMSNVRPKGSPIGHTYQSDGIIPFMKIFNEVTDGTSQGGARKGALMISLDARHKEASEFIQIKQDDTTLSKANLSLEIDNEFMNAVKKFYDTGEVVTLHEKRDYSGNIVEYDIQPINIFKKLAENCYDWGDPACLFVDAFRNRNLLQYDTEYQIETCNPCGEQPLPKHGACCLGSLNLSEFIIDPYTDRSQFNWSDFISAVEIAVKALDDLIDENADRHPLPEQREMSKNYRNIGLGIFGYASALMKLGLTYGSNDAIRFTSLLFSRLFKTAVFASCELAKEFGPYPKYNEIIWESDIIKSHFSASCIEELKKCGIRNCSLISIAPTGSLATLLNESGGCEPEFAIKYRRRTTGMTGSEDTYYDVYCKAAKEYLNLYPSSELPEYFVSSSDIDWKDRVDTQAAMQEHVDTAISSTINLNSSATVSDIEQIYLRAWERGLKGITIFRNGCKKVGILTTDNGSENTKNEYTVETLKRGTLIDVPSDLTYRKYKLSTGCGTLYLFVGIDDDGNIYDVFTNTGGVGGCTINTQANSRLLSACIRGGIPIEYIIEQLEKTGTCPSFQYAKGKGKELSTGKSCPSVIANVLRTILEDTTFPETHIVNETQLSCKDKCPECGSSVVRENGCITCKSCGWSRC